MCHCVNVETREDNSWELILSFCQVGPGHLTQGIRPGSRHPYPTEPSGQTHNGILYKLFNCLRQGLSTSALTDSGVRYGCLIP